MYGAASTSIGWVQQCVQGRQTGGQTGGGGRGTGGPAAGGQAGGWAGRRTYMAGGHPTKQHAREQTCSHADALTPVTAFHRAQLCQTSSSGGNASAEPVCEVPTTYDMLLAGQGSTAW